MIRHCPVGRRPMPRHITRLSAAFLLAFSVIFALAAGASAKPSPYRMASLARGINVTSWYRFPAAWDDAHFTGYLRDSDLSNLKQAGFTYIRLPVDPAVMGDASGHLYSWRVRQLETAIKRINAAGLAVMIQPHPPTSQSFDQAPMQQVIRNFWTELAPAMAKLPADKVFLEIMSEPIFSGRERDWAVLQQELAGIIRRAAPSHTIIATGANWSSIDGLTRLGVMRDSNIAYTFHFYWPMAFTHQNTSWAGQPFQAISGLPWPATDAACQAAAAAMTDAAARNTANWYCREGFNAARLVAEVKRAKDWATKNSAAVVVGEFGDGCGNPNRADRVEWLNDARSAFEANGMGWALWGLDNCMGIGADPKLRDFTIPADMRTALGLKPAAAVVPAAAARSMFMAETLPDDISLAPADGSEATDTLDLALLETTAAAVPEPGSMTLVAVGLLAIAAIGRRGRRTSVRTRQ